jgi:hypothetical protein
MAKILSSFEFREPVGKSTYDWKELADGKIRELTKGTDFNSKAQTVAMMARKYAKKNGLKVHVSAKKDGDTVVLQFYKPDAASAPAAPRKRKK